MSVRYLSHVLRRMLAQLPMRHDPSQRRPLALPSGQLLHVLVVSFAGVVARPCRGALRERKGADADGDHEPAREVVRYAARAEGDVGAVVADGPDQEGGGEGGGDGCEGRPAGEGCCEICEGLG